MAGLLLRIIQNVGCFAEASRNRLGSVPEPLYLDFRREVHIRAQGASWTWRPSFIRWCHLGDSPRGGGDAGDDVADEEVCRLLYAQVGRKMPPPPTTKGRSGTGKILVYSASHYKAVLKVQK